MFRLLHYFSVASFIAFLIVTVLLGFLYRHTAIAELSAQEENKNVVVTNAFVNSLRPQLIAYLALTDGLTEEQLRAHPGLVALQNAIAVEAAGLPVARVKIYNKAGVTIFSTEKDQIGEDEESNDGFTTALNGAIASMLTYRNTLNSFDGELENKDVLSTYFPVRLGKSAQTGDVGSGSATQGPVQGVFELYSDVTPLLQRIDSTQRTLVIGVALILGVLYGTLFLIVRHADGIIRRQHAEQLQAEEELSRQQRTLASLHERERLARELHDNLGQVLGYLNIQAQTVALFWSQGKTHEAQLNLQKWVEVLQDAHVDVRQQIRALRNGGQQKADFPAALERHLAELRKEYDIDTELLNLDAWLACGVDENVGAQLLGIVQEALTNVCKHAQAEHVQVIFDRHVSQGQVTGEVTVCDDGKGFAQEQSAIRGSLHFGLRMMQDRAQEIGATIEVHSALGQGTRIHVIVPLQQAVRA